MHWDQFFISVNTALSQMYNLRSISLIPVFSTLSPTAKKCFPSWFLPASLLFRCKEDLHHHFYHWSCQLNEHHLNSVLKAYDPSFWLGITSTGSISFEQLALMKTPILTSLSWHTILLILWKYCHFVIFSFVATSYLSTESSCITCW